MNRSDDISIAKVISEKKPKVSVDALIDGVQNAIQNSYIKPIANGDLQENDITMKFRSSDFWLMFLIFSFCTIVVDRGLYFVIN